MNRKELKTTLIVDGESSLWSISEEAEAQFFELSDGELGIDGKAPYGVRHNNLLMGIGFEGLCCELDVALWKLGEDDHIRIFCLKPEEGFG